nr:MraY family glycosyltransferase [Novipirellula artificiosorum]
MTNLSQWIGWLVVVSVLPAMLVTWLSLYPVRRFASALGLVAKPGGHSTHAKVTPLGGGIGIWVGIMVTFSAASVAIGLLRHYPELQARFPEALQPYLEGAWSRLGQLWSLLGAATVLVALGVTDDRRGGVNPFFRLAVEFAVAAFVVYGLGFGLTAFIGITWLTNVLSVIWIVGLINSFNMLDNMDGLSGGVAAIIAASMAIVMLTTADPETSRPQVFVAALLMVVCGSLLGFLWHNRPPAKIFMGDGGSYLVGFLIAVAMLMATFASNNGPRPHAMLAPLCVMAVPLYDMTTVLWIRIRQGRSPFVGDRSHFSHRLVELGLSRTQAVLTIYLVTATCGLASILLTHVEIVQAITVIGIVACMLLLVIILESTQWESSDK